MFGLTNRKQEIKDRERELAACQAALEETEQRLSKMSLMWIEAGQRLSEIERDQRELERRFKKVTTAADGVSRESQRQLDFNQRILQRAGDIVEKQESLRAAQEQVRSEVGNAAAETPVSLAKIIAPITAELSNGMEEMRKMLEDVVEIGRQMGVLSLNAAVEAGRMGESGRKFVEAAEEVREMSDHYQQTTATLAQQMQIVGMKWQKSRGEIEEVEERLKRQFDKLEKAKNACTAVGDEMLNLPIADLQIEMEKAFGDESIKERCEDVSQKVEEARQDFLQQKEKWDDLRQTTEQAKAMVKEIQS